MADGAYHLAQFNIARLAAPLDAAELAEFVAFLAPVNAFAEHSPGVVWRLTAPDGASSTYLSSGYDDAMIVPNLSVWTDPEALRGFVYKTVHRSFLQNRRAWFEKMDGPKLVLWWARVVHGKWILTLPANAYFSPCDSPEPSLRCCHCPCSHRCNRLSRRDRQR